MAGWAQPSRHGGGREPVGRYLRVSMRVLPCPALPREVPMNLLPTIGGGLLIGAAGILFCAGQGRERAP